MLTDALRGARAFMSYLRLAHLCRSFLLTEDRSGIKILFRLFSVY